MSVAQVLGCWLFVALLLSLRSAFAETDETDPEILNKSVTCPGCFRALRKLWLAAIDRNTDTLMNSQFDASRKRFYAEPDVPGFVGARGKKLTKKQMPSEPGFVISRGRRSDDPGFVISRGKRAGNSGESGPGFVISRGKRGYGESESNDPGFVISRGRRSRPAQGTRDPGFVISRGRRGFTQSESNDPGFVISRGRRSGAFQGTRDPGFVISRGRRSGNDKQEALGWYKSKRQEKQRRNYPDDWFIGVRG